MYLRFKAFRAIDDLNTCLKFVEGHRNVLKDYGITNITTNSEEWMGQPDIYCLVAEESRTGEIIGGARLHLSTLGRPLPVELAVGRMDESIFSLVNHSRVNGGIGEFCALWNAKRVAGAGISLLLVRAGVALAWQLNIRSLISICAEYTLRLFQRTGFVINERLGDGGVFPYPNETYKARVMQLADTSTLGDATGADRERIMALRANLQQEAVEEGTIGQVTVRYELNIVE